MPPSHQYVSVARELHAALTDVTHDRLRPKDVNEITGNLDIGQALADLRYAAHDVADLVRDVQHVPDQLLRSGLLFAPASKLTASVERLHDRASGRYVSVLPEETPELAKTSRSVVNATEVAARKIDHTINQSQHLAVAGVVDGRRTHIPEL